MNIPSFSLPGLSFASSAPREGHRLHVLFVLTAFGMDEAETELALLAQKLDPARCRLEVFPCGRGENAPQHVLPELARAGVHVDHAVQSVAAQGIPPEDTMRCLERRIAASDVVISCGNAAQVYSVLERMRHRPPLIERGHRMHEAVAGPRHLTTAYAAASEDIRRAAAGRVPEDARHARLIPAMAMTGPAGESLSSSQMAVAGQWQELFDEVTHGGQAAAPALFQSVLQGGFECSTHRLRSGRRLDLIAATAHDTSVASDYLQLAGFGMRTFRDGLRWHLIEQASGVYDFSSFLPMLRASCGTGSQIIWDLMHYGWPDGLDIWSPGFADRFARFARAAALLVREETDAVPFWCPVNEISYFAWAGGDAAYLNPFATGRSFELKVQLARASIAAMHALREVDPRSRFVHCEPLIAVHPDPENGRGAAEAEGWHQAQFQAFELLSGQMWPQIGGQPDFLDILGVNYYDKNQWVLGGATLDRDDPRYRPFSDMLFELYARCHRPVLISETGTEGDGRAGWFAYVASEVLRARRRGVPVEGICLYPVVNHSGWDDDRECPSGLLSLSAEQGRRTVHEPLARAMEAFRGRLDSRARTTRLAPSPL
jgi:hypothetical protein